MEEQEYSASELCIGLEIHRYIMGRIKRHCAYVQYRLHTFNNTRATFHKTQQNTYAEQRRAYEYHPFNNTRHKDINKKYHD
jgi:hypothetical protein